MRVRILAIALLTTLSASVFAQDANEFAIKYRQSGYTMVYWNFKPMGEMLGGKIEFNAEAFKQHASNLANITQVLQDGFPKGSYIEGKTEALPAIWENWSDFTSKMGDFKAAAQGLSTAAAGSDMDAIKAAFGKTKDSCKACHDNYKAD